MTENENKNKSSLWWRRGFVIAFAIIVIFFVVYSTGYNFKLSYELLAILALLLFLIIYDDVKEISIGSILSIKKEVEKVAKEQEKLNTIITTLTINQRTEQNVNIQVPEKESLPEKKDETENKELILELINQNREYYNYFKQWEEYSKQRNQTVYELQKELEQARKVIENLIIRKEIAEFNYLNYFFVYNTKSLLHWLVRVKTVTISGVRTQALIMSINQNNIQTTIEVLRDNYMIAVDVENGNITSTPRAKRFLDFIGFGKKLSDELFSKLLNDYLSKSK